jgi:hypothetical protein
VPRIRPGNGHSQDHSDDDPNRDLTIRARDNAGRRIRIRFADADTIRTRVQDAAAELKLRGSRQHVLEAVLKLLCRWSRLSDDRVRMHQLAHLLSGSDEWHDKKTIGRALKALADAQLLTYTPAQGRGRHATIAIHERFLGRIEELERDDSTGKVVTFSEPTSLSLSKEEKPHVTPRSEIDSKRPSGVKFDRTELRNVLREMPAAYQALPKHLRWQLGGEIYKYLGRGWRPDQILAVLEAPLPDNTTRPFRLAKWRFTQNLLGSGPRLAPAQKAWDQRQQVSKIAEATTRDTELDATIEACTSPTLRQQMISGLRHHLGLKLRPNEVLEDSNAVRQAARIARRHHPELELSAAIDRWLQQCPPPAVKPAALVGIDRETHPDLCISCNTQPGVTRHELPLASIVCEDCWTQTAGELAA